MPKVLIAAPVHELLLDGLRALGYELVLKEKIRQEEAPALLSDCTGVVTSTRLLLNRELLDALPGLQWIGRMGSGMEIIDTAFAAEKGIRCFSSPEGNANAVAEHTLGMLLSITKNITASALEVIGGTWAREENRGFELEGRTAGIIGMGHTGTAFARKLRGMDMRLIGYDSNPNKIFPEYVQRVSLEELHREAEVLSFHVPLKADTKGYFNKDFLQRMVRPFFLINTSRGPVVETAALFEGLRDGRIRAAALDVLEQEPHSLLPAGTLDTMREFSLGKKLLITPHIAGYSFESVEKMSRALLDKITAIHLSK